MATRRSINAAAVDRIVAIDWSGDRSAAGQRRKIWAGVWTRAAHSTGMTFGGTVRMESGRTRDELAQWLIALARKTPRMVIGVDCCFSYPAWFLAEHGCATISDFWRAVAAGKGEEWLHRECADERFWGVAGPARTGKRPQEFSGPGLRRMMRSTDWENKIAVRQHGGDPERAARMHGITPKSPFQIGGSGSVGTGSLRAMPMLLQLSGAGFDIWPFEDSGLAELAPRPLVVEMYTRLLTGAVAKSNETARRQYLRSHRASDSAYAGLTRAALTAAYGSEDAFDALVCCVEMARSGAQFPALRATEDPLLLLEGITWRPGV